MSNNLLDICFLRSVDIYLSYLFLLQCDICILIIFTFLKLEPHQPTVIRKVTSWSIYFNCLQRYSPPTVQLFLKINIWQTGHATNYAEFLTDSRKISLSDYHNITCSRKVLRAFKPDHRKLCFPSLYWNFEVIWGRYFSHVYIFFNLRLNSSRQRVSYQNRS